jgi:hypothetical protein
MSLQARITEALEWNSTYRLSIKKETKLACISPGTRFFWLTITNPKS